MWDQFGSDKSEEKYREIMRGRALDEKLKRMRGEVKTPKTISRFDKLSDNPWSE